MRLDQKFYPQGRKPDIYPLSPSMSRSATLPLPTPPGLGLYWLSTASPTPLLAQSCIYSRPSRHLYASLLPLNPPPPPSVIKRNRSSQRENRLAMQEKEYTKEEKRTNGRRPRADRAPTVPLLEPKPREIPPFSEMRSREPCTGFSHPTPPHLLRSDLRHSPHPPNLTPPQPPPQPPPLPCPSAPASPPTRPSPPSAVRNSRPGPG